ncbi:hypothetical protein [Ruminiclostridium josui]|uniref:hypothetical protein n=1 Tax=Ruminiclostridium josui TaxID=1499 RepID=UPI0006D257FA|nr:hypothetical protein [Ruminiclostridium josui]
MKKFRTLSICVVTIFLIGLLLVILFFQRTNFKGNGYHFIQFNSSFAAEQHSNYVIDLPYFIKSSNKDILLKDNILNIRFKNSSLTEVEKFDLKFGDKLRNYVTKTVSLTTKFIKSGKENIKYIEVTLKDGKKLIFILEIGILR